METGTAAGLAFAPRRAEGWPAVTEIAVFPDRLEVRSAGRWVTVRLAEIARWPRPAPLWKWLAGRGYRSRPAPVGERDWFCAPERYFRFYTDPPLTIYLPEEPEEDLQRTLFRRLEDTLLAGGFHTWDLG